MENLVENILSVQNIAFYCNLGLIGIVLISLIGLFRGVGRGVWKTSFSVFYYGILILLLILLVGNISTALYNMDLTWLKNITHFNMAVDGVEQNTAGEYVHALVESYAKQSNMNVNMADAQAAIDGLAIAVIRLLTYIIGLILILITGLILCPLLYHLIFKHIIPKKVRKEKKLRVLGGVLGFAKSLVITGLCFIPISGLLSSVTSSIKDEDGNIKRANNYNTTQNSDANVMYDLVMNILEGYDASYLSKVLGLPINGSPMDKNLMNFITQSDFGNNQDVCLYNEFGTFASIFVDAMSTGAINLATSEVSMSVLLESQFAKNTLYALANSSLVNVLLPIGLGFALDQTSNIENFNAADIDISNIDWSNTLRSAGDIMDDIANTGYISAYFEDPDNFFNNFALDRLQEVKLNNALVKLGSSSVVKELMPQIAASYFASFKKDNTEAQASIKKAEGQEEVISTETSSGPQFEFNMDNFLKELPEEATKPETYKNIDWGSELSLFYKTTLNISDQYKAANGEYITFSKLQEVMDPNNLGKVLLGTKQEFNTYEDYQNNVYVEGGKVGNEDIVGLKGVLGIKENTKGILDSSVLNTALFGIDGLTTAVNNLSVKSRINYNSMKILKEEIKDWTMDDLKEEVGKLVSSTSSIITVYEDIQDILNNAPEDEKTGKLLSALSTGNTKLGVNYFCDTVKQSYLAGTFVPAFAQDYLVDVKMPLTLGLTTADLNVSKFREGTSFFTELKDLANNTFSLLGDVLTEMTSEDKGFTKIVNISDSLEQSLINLYNSQIFNPQVSEGNSNFTKIMSNLLTKLDDGEDASLNIPAMTNNLLVVSDEAIAQIAKVDETTGKDSWEKEIGSLFDVIDSLKAPEGESQILLDYLNDSSSVDLNNEFFNMGDEIKRVFSAVDNSIIMKDALPETLNNTLKESLVNAGLDIDFKEITDWSNEGEHLGNALNTLGDMRGDDSSNDIATAISNADSTLLTKKQFLKNTDETTIKLRETYNSNYDEYVKGESQTYNLISELSQTQSIGESDVLSNTLYNAIYNVITGTGIVENKDTNPDLWAKVEQDFKFNNKNIIYKDEVYVSYYSSSDSYPGEAVNISKLMAYKNDLDDLTSLTDDTENLSDLLTTLMDNYVLRNLITPILENNTNKLKTSESSESFKTIIDSVYFGIFDSEYMTMDSTSETPLIKNRSEEIEARTKYEIPALIELFVMKDDLQGDLNVSAVQDLAMHEVGQDSKIISLLKKLNDSFIFNYNGKDKPNGITKEGSTYSAYEEILYTALGQETILTNIYDDQNVKQKGLTTGEAVLRKYIELENRTTIDGLSMFDTTDLDGDLNKVFDFIIALGDDGTINVSDIKASADLLKQISDIYLLHDIVPHLIRTVSSDTVLVEGKKLSDMYVNESNPPKYYVLEPNSMNEVASSYDNEIDSIADLIDQAKEAAAFEGDIKDMDEVSFKERKLFENLISEFADSSIFNNVAPDITTYVINQLSYETYNLAYFIDNEPTSTIKERAIIVEDNFSNKQGEDTLKDCYAKEGASLDLYIYEMIKIAKADVSSKIDTINGSTSDPNGYIGGVMMANVKETLIPTP